MQKLGTILLLGFVLAGCQSTAAGDNLVKAGFVKVSTQRYDCGAKICGTAVSVVKTLKDDDVAMQGAPLTAEETVRSGQFEGSEAQVFIRQQFGAANDAFAKMMPGLDMQVEQMVPDRANATVLVSAIAHSKTVSTWYIRLLVKFRGNKANGIVVSSQSAEVATRYTRADWLP